MSIVDKIKEELIRIHPRINWYVSDKHIVQQSGLDLPPNSIFISSEGNVDVVHLFSPSGDATEEEFKEDIAALAKTHLADPHVVLQQASILMNGGE